LNVTLPFAAHSGWKLQATSVARDLYRGLFQKKGEYYEHALSSVDLKTDGRPDGDFETVLAGHVSVSEIDIWPVGRLDEERRAALQERLSAGRCVVAEQAPG
jgi:hypothetical protein